jgi:hypothetical protein
MLDGETQRYPLLPLFLVALFLLLAAPVYWRTLEQPIAKGKERAYENAQLYQRVYPMMHYGFGRLRQGELPLWSSGQLCGTPFLANPQAGLFQPLNAVFLLADTGYALAAQAFLALFFMGFGFVLFARSLGTGFTAALIGGVTYAFSGATAAAVSRPELAGVLAWTPFFFWSVREYTVAWQYSRAVMGGMFAALVLLAGSFALGAAMLVFGLAYALVRVALATSYPAVARRTRLGGILVLVVTALLLSMIQWLPALQWLAGLGAPWKFLLQVDVAGDVPRSLGALIEQLLTAPRGQLPPIGYVGIVALAVLPAAYFNRYSQIEAGFFTAGAVLLPALALAGEGPRAGSFSPVLLLFPAVFSVAVLAALGADRLLTTGRDPRSPLVWVPALLSIICAALLFWIAPAPLKGILLILAVVLLPFLIIRAGWLAALSGAAVVAIVVIDLALAARNEYLHPFEDSPECYQVYEKALLFAEEQALGGRMMLSAQALDVGLAPNLGLLYPMRLAGSAFQPLTEEQAAWWARLTGETPAAEALAGARLSPAVLAPALLNYMAVRVLLKGPGSPLGADLWPAEGASFRLTRQMDNVDVFINGAAFPRARWVPRWESAASHDEALDRLADPAFDGATTCVITAGGGDLEQLLATVPVRESIGSGDPTVPETMIEMDMPERIVIHTVADRPGLLVLADTFAPGWKATVDGQAAPILRANGLFRAIAVLEGPHVIEMRYQPWTWYAGAAVSAGTLLCLLVLALIQPALRKRRRARAMPEPARGIIAD